MEKPNYNPTPAQNAEANARAPVSELISSDLRSEGYHALSPQEIARLKDCSLSLTSEGGKTKISGNIENQEVSLIIDEGLDLVRGGDGSTVFHVQGHRGGVELSPEEASELFRQYRKIAIFLTNDRF